MKCPVCNAEINDDAIMCEECGTMLDPKTNEYFNPELMSEPARQIKPRSIPLAIIFSLLTCGIYGIYWLVCLNDDINTLTGNQSDTSGVMVVIFTLLTCGIYGWFWMWKTGEKVDKMKGSANSNIAYLILGIFGLGIVAYALMQDAINKQVQY